MDKIIIEPVSGTRYILEKKISGDYEAYVEQDDLKTELINGLIPFLSEKTGRIPIILPIIMDIKNYNNEK